VKKKLEKKIITKKTYIRRVRRYQRKVEISKNVFYKQLQELTTNFTSSNITVSEYRYYFSTIITRVVTTTITTTEYTEWVTVLTEQLEKKLITKTFYTKTIRKLKRKVVKKGWKKKIVIERKKIEKKIAEIVKKSKKVRKVREQKVCISKALALRLLKCDKCDPAARSALGKAVYRSRRSVRRYYGMRRPKHYSRVGKPLIRTITRKTKVGRPLIRRRMPMVGGKGSVAPQYRERTATVAPSRGRGTRGN